jgi:hypothetical protein
MGARSPRKLVLVQHKLLMPLAKLEWIYSQIPGEGTPCSGRIVYFAFFHATYHCHLLFRRIDLVGHIRVLLS